MLVQGEEEFSAENTLQTFYVIIGDLGGLAGAIMPLIALAIGGYQQFSYEKSLVRRLFLVSPPRGKQRRNTLATNDPVTEDMETSINSREFFKYSYGELLRMKFFLKCCCCCVRRRKANSESFRYRTSIYEKWNLTLELLAAELDIEAFIRSRRVNKFVS